MKKKFPISLTVVTSITLTTLQNAFAQSWVITGNNNLSANMFLITVIKH